MTTVSSYRADEARHAPDNHPGGFTPLLWLRRAEAALDDRGRGAWITLLILSLVFVWPVGIALLAYMIWSGRMFSCSSKARMTRHRSSAPTSFGSSGNAAFDAYKTDTLNRLEAEERAFHDFLERLRESRDKAEFDQYMEERARAAAAPQDAPERPAPGAA